MLLKTGSDWIMHFIGLAIMWDMSHYTMLYEYGKHMYMYDFFEAFVLFLKFSLLYFGAFLIKQLFHSPLLDMR